MPDPADHPTPATPDELAAIYLRARDVPCPGCGYNRRDGISAKCPECGQGVVLGVRAPGMLESPSRRVRRLMYLIICVSTLSLLAYLCQMVAYAMFVGTTSFIGTLDVWNLTYLGVFIAGSTTTMVFAAMTIRRIARQDPTAEKSMRRAALFFALTLAPGMTWSLITSLGRIIDSL